MKWRYIILAAALLTTVLIFLVISVHEKKANKEIERLSDKANRLMKELGFYPNHRTSQTECPKDRVITGIPAGRIGNQVWEYASIWAVVKIYSEKETLLGYSTNETLDILARVFEKMSLPALGTLPFRCLDLETAQIVAVNDTPKSNPSMSLKSPIVLQAWSYRYPDVLKVGLDKFRQEFRVRDKLLKNSQIRLLEAKVKLNRRHEVNTTFIGVHHRGTDYPRFLHVIYENPKLVTSDYYAKAMRLMRERHKNTLFVVTSDDRTWCQNNIKGTDVVISENNDAGNDLALLSSCNHTIVSYGTFGATAAVLAGGDTILFMVEQKKEYNGAKLSTSMSRSIDNWFAIK